MFHYTDGVAFSHSQEAERLVHLNPIDTFLVSWQFSTNCRTPSHVNTFTHRAVYTTNSDAPGANVDVDVVGSQPICPYNHVEGRGYLEQVEFSP